MDVILSQSKNIRLEGEKEFKWSTGKKPRAYVGRKRPRARPRPRPRTIIIEPSPQEKELEFRRMKLERHLSDLRALKEPEKTIEQAEEFLEHFEPQTKEEEMMVETVWKQLEMAKEWQRRLEIK